MVIAVTRVRRVILTFGKQTSRVYLPNGSLHPRRTESLVLYLIVGRTKAAVADDAEFCVNVTFLNMVRSSFLWRVSGIESFLWAFESLKHHFFSTR